MRRQCALLLALLVALNFAAPLGADPTPPPQAAETLRNLLVQGQLLAATDRAGATQALAAARTTYAANLATTVRQFAPDADARIEAGLTSAAQAVETGDTVALADARAQTWTALLAGSYTVVERSLAQGNGAQAQAWLPLREFRRATRFSRPNADATLAVEAALAGTRPPQAALLDVRADLLDTYQARLSDALAQLTATRDKGFAARRAEHAALAAGYFDLLAPAYEEQRGAAELAAAQRAFAALRQAARDGQPLAEALAQVEAALSGFRAAPLSQADQTRRAGQLLRFLSLVAVEYGRGVKNGVVTRDFEVQEAITFRDGAAAAFADLRAILEARDPRATDVAARLSELEQRLTAALGNGQVASADEVEALVGQTTALLTTIMPPEWQQRDTAADFDVIHTVLQQVETAVAAGEYDQAESARLEAYAILETGPEARLLAFAPQHIPTLENLFWYGQDEPHGLAYLIQNHAPVAAVRATRIVLDTELDTAEKALAGGGAPAVVATNAGVIVFREGLEAVLILASLTAGLRRGSQRKLRRPLWWGAGAALLVTALTFLAARGVLTQFARYGEKLEAVVSLVAIGVLLLITNWFFHKAYWVDWMAGFHVRKHGLVNGEMGQWLGLAALGFTSIYREGFETVLFLQALVLESGMAIVMAGVLGGLLATVLIGVILFSVQRKLPYKKMLIATGLMIVGVLIIMVGNTVHVLQVVGWMPLHPLRSLSLPYWTGLWFGVYPTWEGLTLQFLAATFVIGSYFLAEHLQHRRVARTILRSASSEV